MSDTQDDPLLGLLTDIAEAVATLVARVDTMETAAAAHQAQVNEALATIAEIATRTYYVSKPASALPDDVINAPVMNRMIDRWPSEWRMMFPPPDYAILTDLEALSVEEIEVQLRARARINKKATNAQRLRHTRALFMLGDEMDKRFKEPEESIARDRRGRSR